MPTLNKFIGREIGRFLLHDQSCTILGKIAVGSVAFKLETSQLKMIRHAAPPHRVDRLLNPVNCVLLS